jgi:hypothetical protein
MDGDTTDEESVTVHRHRPSSSSSGLVPMSEEENIVFRRIQEKLRNNEIIRVVDVRKPQPGQTVVRLHVHPHSTLQIEHLFSHFSVSGGANEESAGLVSDVNDYCNSGACRSLNCIFDKISELVRARAQSDDEDEEEDMISLSSGTTAASPQSSRSTTTSLGPQ